MKASMNIGFVSIALLLSVGCTPDGEAYLQNLWETQGNGAMESLGNLAPGTTETATPASSGNINPVQYTPVGGLFGY